MYKLIFTDPIVFVALAVALVLALSIHEFAHAFAAYKLGDYTAKALGRVTLNPLAHLDPVGTLLLLVAGFGWGKPVPFNPENLSNPKRDSAIIAFAGPLSNFILAIIGAVLIHIVGTVVPVLGAFLHLFVYYNLILGFFNLIPVHPLDGFKVVYGLLPTNLGFQWLQMEQYGIIVLLILVFTDTTSAFITPLMTISLKLLGLSF